MNRPDTCSPVFIRDPLQYRQADVGRDRLTDAAGCTLETPVVIVWQFNPGMADAGLGVGRVTHDRWSRGVGRGG
jgi:hypothetical protein